jgi:4-alpha-glucanotransferase
VVSRRALHALASRVGILPSYVDQTGVVRHAADSSRVALLEAMGFAAATEAQARRSLRALAAADASRLVEASRVVGAAAARRVPWQAADRGPRRRRWAIEVVDEAGQMRRAEGTLPDGRRDGGLVLPRAPAPGYYRLRLAVGGFGAPEQVGEQALIVTPGRCTTAADLGVRRAFGLLANLYTVRGHGDFGAGDFGDLRALVDLAGRLGGAFVGVNPLHALANGGDEISPYSPLSRLFRNPLYLDVEEVPELRESRAARARLAAPRSRAALARLRAAAHVDYAGVMREKEAVLHELHHTFVARHRGRGTARGIAYARYREQEGAALVDFATFLALRVQLAPDGGPRRDWHRWRAGYRDAHGADVRAFRVRNAEAVDYHCWVQFELDRQLGAVAARARAAGLALGVYQDLALGSSPFGADPWAFPSLFLQGGVSVGAPPDPLGPEGQNWGLPPIDPLALARDGYGYWVRLLRAAFRHAGALRVDHVMGLFRQFWIPRGRPGSEGAYMRMPAEALLGVLALESRRAGALVIGEDLGTVPRGLPAQLARWGILSTRVLTFEQQRRGTFRPSRGYLARALVCANTHDMAPLAGFWRGRDLTLRRQVGSIPSDAALRSARDDRERTKDALLRRLRAERRLPAGTPSADGALCAAVHSFLARTPATLLGLSLDDLAGEQEPVNLPGVGLDGFPSWSRKMTRALPELARAADVRRALGDVPAVRGAGSSGSTGSTSSIKARRSRSRRRARSRAR